MNDLSWNLTELFKDVDSFYREIDYVRNQLSKIKEYENMILDADKLFLLLNESWNLRERSNKVLIYGSLRYYKNVNDVATIKLKKDAETFNNKVISSLKFIDLKIIELGKNKVNIFLEENPGLKVYELYLDNLFRIQEHILGDGISLKIKDITDLLNEKLSLYNELLNNIVYGEIDVDAEVIQINSSNIKKYISHKDREVRKRTYLTVNKAFRNNEKDFADILNSLYVFRTEIAKLENYDSVLEKVLSEENINPEIIDTLLKVVNNRLPLMQRYLKLKAKYLNISNLHLYDLSVSLDSNLDITYAVEEAIIIIKEALKPLGSKYLEVVDLLLDGHIDALADSNKHQLITFSWNTYSFMNFRGTYVDLKNMIHEIGHIVNYYLSKERQPFIYEDSSVFTGELAAIVNGILLNKYLYEKVTSREEKIFYLSKEIENYCSSIFKQTMYTEFEKKLYSIVSESTLTSKLLSAKYNNIIKKYYGSNVIYDNLSGIEWMRLGHLYRWSYYPYKYATGLIMASIVVNSLVNEKTLNSDQYMDFLAAGSSQYPLDLLKMLNIDLSDLNTINDGFKVLEDDIEKLDKILE